jgi:hypothetical protein
VRTAIVIGVAVTTGLWTYTRFDVSRQLADVKTEAAALTARYDQAQRLLMTVRSQVMWISVRVRDALLSQSPAAIAEHREDMEESFRLINMALEDYEPVARSPKEGDAIILLRSELDRFKEASVGALGRAPGRSPAEVRRVLDGLLMPRREAALTISEEIQTLNRQAYIAHQTDVARLYEAADRRTRRQLNIGLAVNLVLLLLIALYAARLDARLRMQLTRDVPLSP